MKNKINYTELKLGKYDIPSWDGLGFPILLVLSKFNELSAKQLCAEVLDAIQIPDDLKFKTYPNQEKGILEDRIKWGYSELTSAGLLKRPKRAIYHITNLGKRVLEDYGIKLNAKIIHEQKPYVQHLKEVSFRNSTHNVDDDLNLKQVSADDTIKIINKAATNFNNTVASDLLAYILDAEPYFFERIVVRLLVAMGYQGNGGNSLVTTKSNDGGIDGIINQDPLGTSTVYIQAKRYQRDNRVQRPDINSFVGALEERNASRGVFITTSDFSSGAIERAKHSSIVLINGVKLTDLMLKYQVGVQRTQEFTLFKIDEDFFDDSNY